MKTGVLDNWRTINQVLMTLTRKEVVQLIMLERESHRRARILKRLHQRLCRLRAIEEEKSLLKPGKHPLWLHEELR